MNVVVNDLDLNFQSKTFQMAILSSIDWKMQRLLLPSDLKSDICHHMAPLQILCVVTLTYIFKIMKFEM